MFIQEYINWMFLILYFFCQNLLVTISYILVIPVFDFGWHLSSVYIYTSLLEDDILKSQLKNRQKNNETNSKLKKYLICLINFLQHSTYLARFQTKLCYILQRIYYIISLSEQLTLNYSYYMIRYAFSLIMLRLHANAF